MGSSLQELSVLGGLGLQVGPTRIRQEAEMWREEDSGFVERPNGSGEGVFVSGHGVDAEPSVCSAPFLGLAGLGFVPGRPRALPASACWVAPSGEGQEAQAPRSPPPSAFIFPMPLLHFLEFCVVSKPVSKETFELTVQHARWTSPQKPFCWAACVSLWSLYPSSSSALSSCLPQPRFPGD